MADISHLHPLVQDALRTGRVPERAALARLLNRDVDDIADPDGEADDGTDEEYLARVTEKIDDWLDDHPGYGNNVPAELRHRIEDDCRRQLDHERSRRDPS